MVTGSFSVMEHVFIRVVIILIVFFSVCFVFVIFMLFIYKCLYFCLDVLVLLCLEDELLGLEVARFKGSIGM